jgi:hypothetical protein
LDTAAGASFPDKSRGFFSLLERQQFGFEAYLVFFSLDIRDKATGS